MKIHSFIAFSVLTLLSTRAFAQANFCFLASDNQARCEATGCQFIEGSHTGSCQGRADVPPAVSQFCFINNADPRSCNSNPSCQYVSSDTPDSCVPMNMPQQAVAAPVYIPPQAPPPVYYPQDPPVQTPPVNQYAPPTQPAQSSLVQAAPEDIMYAPSVEHSESVSELMKSIAGSGKPLDSVRVLRGASVVVYANMTIPPSMFGIVGLDNGNAYYDLGNGFSVSTSAWCEFYDHNDPSLNGRATPPDVFEVGRRFRIKSSILLSTHFGGSPANQQERPQVSGFQIQLDDPKLSIDCRLANHINPEDISIEEAERLLSSTLKLSLKITPHQLLQAPEESLW